MAFLPIDREDEVIDSYRPQTDNTSPLVTHSDTPNENRPRSYFAPRKELPDPSIGGEPSSGFLNGFSTGFRSMFNRLQPFNGAVVSAPPTSNNIQGEVGLSSRATRLHAGVMSQLVGYSASQSAYNAAWVGIPPAGKV